MQLLRRVRIGCGDMFKIINDDFRNVIKDIEEEYNDREIVFVSDPPFNVGYHYNSYNDKLDEREYDDLMISAFGNGKRSVVIHYPEALYRLSSKINCFPSRVISWVYNSNTRRQHRDICYFNIEPKLSNLTQSYKNVNDKRVHDLIESGKEGCQIYDWWYVDQVKNVSEEKTNHPCQMPLKVMDNIIKTLPVGCLVIDPFCGSGTTGVACVLNGVDFIGIDLDKTYCEIAECRIREVISGNVSVEDGKAVKRKLW